MGQNGEFVEGEVDMGSGEKRGTSGFSTDWYMSGQSIRMLKTSTVSGKPVHLEGMNLTHCLI